MIPLTRRSTSRRLETALLSCSRQSLPRPARFYTTPSRRAQAPALATSSLKRNEYSFELESQRQSQIPGSSSAARQERNESLSGFLRRPAPYTLLPTPAPSDASSPLRELVFPGTPVQDSLSVIDACLHNCFDVKRAQYVFDMLRSSPSADAVLHPRVYNLLLEAYLSMAQADPVPGEISDDPGVWLTRSWQLFSDMDNGKEKAEPSAGTFAIMLKTWLK
jgi:DNA-directed RNA polymerase, mitochondrial